MKWRKPVIIGSILCTLLIVLCIQLYVYIHKDEWIAKRQLIDIAFAESELMHVNRSTYSYGEETLGIVYGEDERDDPMLVMIMDQKVVDSFRISELYAEERVKADVSTAYPDEIIIRIQPSKKNGAYVWEVYSKKKVNQQTSYAYHYYHLESGIYIDTYKLGSR
jgi:uncharacterized protein YpmB